MEPRTWWGCHGLGDFNMTSKTHKLPSLIDVFEMKVNLGVQKLAFEGDIFGCLCGCKFPIVSVHD